MMKKILAAVLALSVFSVSASTLPAELGNLKNIESKLIEQGVDVESLKESALELNLDPTLTDEEVVATVVDFTRSQLETGAAFEDDGGGASLWITGLVLLSLSVIASLGEKDSHEDFANASFLGGYGIVVYCSLFTGSEETRYPKGCSQ